MLINLSNHPSDNWGRKQTSAALSVFEHTEDIQFPHIDPEMDIEDVQELAQEYFEKCMQLFYEYDEEISNNGDSLSEHVVHIQGEFTFTHCIVSILQQNNIRCLASTTKRIVSENEDGTRTYKFEFVRFREYC